MTGKPNRLVILGSSVTALAVARNAADLGMRPIVFDRGRDIATSTWRAEVRAFPGADSASLLEELLKAGMEAPACLIATSDAWLRFVAEHRDALQRPFAEVLQPTTSTLAICLDKTAFAAWCTEQKLPTPRCFDANRIARDSEMLPFPLLLRPQQTSHSPQVTIPKALEVHDRAELMHWMETFKAAAVTPLVTESLLGRRLTQYSVGAARRGNALMTFVAAKRRPLPEQCAVGSYVELSPDKAVELLARRALEALDYKGIAEVEILRDEDSQQDYLIEINARPWVQYGLGPASGHDLLAFLLDPNGYDARNAVTVGKRWLNFSADLYVCFSASTGLVRKGRIPLGAYVSSLLRANTFAYFSSSDPRPALRMLVQLARDISGTRSQ